VNSENEPKSPEPEEEPGEEPDAPAQKSFVAKALLALFDFVKTVVVIVILAYAIRIFLIQPYIVEGQSMEPGFHNKDYLITEKVSYRINPPQRGEVIIFHPPENPSISYIKRIVGLPGDNIKIKDGCVYINEQRIIEPYLSSNEQTLTSQNSEFVTALQKDQYFVMGDNRNHSRDSRELGVIPKVNIVSKVWFRLLPFQDIKVISHVEYETALENLPL